MDGIAITGMGAMTPYGGVDSLFNGLMECRSCLELLSIFETDLDPVPVVGQIRHIPPVEVRRGGRLSRTDKLSVLASRGAVDQAGLDGHSIARAGVVFATTVGGLAELSPEVARDPRAYYGKNGLPVSYPRGHAADIVCSDLGIEGPRLGISTACASVSVMLAGGGEALCWFTISGFHALQSLDPFPCKPFDLERNGLNIGEGAGVLVLENMRYALERKAEILAVLLGWGMSNDAYHLTAPDENGSGLAESIHRALRMAKVAPDAIGYVNAHGTGTHLNDIAEAKAYRKISQTRSSALNVSSTKSYFGHTLGAAGTLEAIATILSLRHGVLFPTLRLSHPLEIPGVDWLRNGVRRQQLELAISASAGFGGSNTSLLFGLPR
jgi:3-oxoacyl-[acyl-carrier-protein] synthase II